MYMSMYGCVWVYLLLLFAPKHGRHRRQTKPTSTRTSRRSNNNVITPLLWLLLLWLLLLTLLLTLLFL